MPEFLKRNKIKDRRVARQKLNLASKMAYLSQIEYIIREKKNVSISEVSLYTGLGYSTLYHYADLVTIKHPDIGFHNKRFFIISERGS